MHPAIEQELHALGLDPARAPSNSGWRDWLKRLESLLGSCSVNGQSRNDALVAHVFQRASEGMLILDAERRVLSANPAYFRITDLQPREVNGQVPRFHGRAPSGHACDLIWDGVARDGSWIGEINARRSDGSTYPLWLTLEAIRGDDGEVANYVALLSDLSELKRSQDALQYVATHDPLTDLPNRMLLQDRLSLAVERARRSGKVGALFFLDIDRFKIINDNLGHDVGDDLLCQVAERLRGACRGGDTLARIGGDEFTLIAEGLESSEDAATVARKLLQVFEQPFQLQDFEPDVSASIGIVIFPRDGEEVAQLLKHADTAMYAAKDAGRNAYRFYTRELTNSAFEFFAVEMALRKALQENQFFLVYQPQYDLYSGQLIGVEALVRWHHPQLGVVAPGMFIHIAEVTGLIEPLGEWVFREACEQLKRWDAAGLPPFMVGINLSRRQLINSCLANRYADMLRETGVDGRRLELEITESAILEREEVAYQNLQALHDMGLHLAIDDFGTGYSSLVNLKRFPVDRLKIDRTFVRDVTEDPNDEAIIRATIALGRSLQLTVIAEGVETEQQRSFLRVEGCHQAQGFLLSRPVAPERIAERLQYDPADSAA